jgi:hypothetical protein
MPVENRCVPAQKPGYAVARQILSTGEDTHPPGNSDYVPVIYKGTIPCR